MSTLTLRRAKTEPFSGNRAWRDGIIAGVTVAVALFVLYAVYLDQGALLSTVFGESAWTANYLHEFAHDGRHLFGAPCH